MNTTYRGTVIVNAKGQFCGHSTWVDEYPDALVLSYPNAVRFARQIVATTPQELSIVSNHGYENETTVMMDRQGNLANAKQTDAYPFHVLALIDGQWKDTRHAFRTQEEAEQFGHAEVGVPWRVIEW